jgi:hypothetical protein
MSKAVYLDEKKLIEKGVAALYQALGPVETGRFIALTRTRRIDSVRRHREWQRQLDKMKFFDQIFQT